MFVHKLFAFCISCYVNTSNIPGTLAYVNARETDVSSLLVLIVLCMSGLDWPSAAVVSVSVAALCQRVIAPTMFQSGAEIAGPENAEPENSRPRDGVVNAGLENKKNFAGSGK